MFLAELNKSKRWLHLSFIGHVCAAELEAGRADVAAALAELPSGFLLLTDLERLDRMDIECTEGLGKIMELCDQKGVASAVRIVPSPDKDIGFNIISLFHYQHRPPVATCSTLAEATKLLGG